MTLLLFALLNPENLPPCHLCLVTNRKYPIMYVT